VRVSCHALQQEEKKVKLPHIAHSKYARRCTAYETAGVPARDVVSISNAMWRHLITRHRTNWWWWCADL